MIDAACNYSPDAHGSDDHAPYDYKEFQRRAQRLRQHQRRQRRSLGVLACASVLFIGAAAWLARVPGMQGEVSGVAQPVSDQPPPTFAAASLTRFAAGATLPAERAAAMLAALPPSSAVVRVDTRIAANRLEDRIALLDEQLNDAQFDGDTLSRIHTLHSERVQLVDSLVRVRYAEQLAASIR